MADKVQTTRRFCELCDNVITRTHTNRCEACLIFFEDFGRDYVNGRDCRQCGKSLRRTKEGIMMNPYHKKCLKFLEE